MSKPLFKQSVIPGFGVTLGFTLAYLGLIVLIPLSAVVWKTTDLTLLQFWQTISEPRVVASLKLSFGAALIAAAVNGVFGLILAWALVRYSFPGKKIVDTLVDLPFALPTAVAGIALTAIYAKNGWLGQYLEPLGLKIAFTPLGIMIALIIIYTFVTRKTVFGRHMYALGGNEKAAGLSGVNIKRVLNATFINMGVLAGLAGLVFAARLNAGTPKAGNGFELDAIAACFIGGASVYGGTGTVSGALIGCLIMGVMNNGMSIMGIAVDLQQAIKGLVILAAVAFDMYAKSKEN